ncbi:MAG: LD-carboxypeptidase [Eubacterium sp.]|nr:LD-carboxypeptidase [Eubacterium sp.]
MKVGLVACSNGQKSVHRDELGKLKTYLGLEGIQCAESRFLYAKDGISGGTPKERAGELMMFYLDSSVDVIFDISGGDIANEILDYLDYDVIRKSGKRFWGYSDLTTVINAIYTKTENPSVLWQAKNLVWKSAEEQRQRFHDSVLGKGKSLYDFEYRFLQGSEMAGVVVGGNIRCLLKLMGTPYWPSMGQKILLLESYGGEEAQLRSYFAQLSQMGVFRRIAGLMLGTFTQYEKSSASQTVFELMRNYLPARLPVAKTEEIGHGSDAHAIVIGEYARFI